MPRLYQFEPSDYGLKCFRSSDPLTASNEFSGNDFALWVGLRRGVSHHFQWDIAAANELENESDVGQKIDALFEVVSRVCKNNFLWAEKLIPYPESTSQYLLPEYLVLRADQKDKDNQLVSVPVRLSVFLFVESERDALALSEHKGVCAPTYFKEQGSNEFAKTMGRCERAFLAAAEKWAPQIFTKFLLGKGDVGITKHRQPV